jgi:uncharacterized protein YjbJ (UPF0337 family)
MTPDNTEQVAGGALGKVAGRIKETAGEALGRDDLAREGRLQQAGADAEIEARQRDDVAGDEQAEADIESRKADTEAERARLHAEVDAERQEARIEADADRAEAQAEQQRAAETAEAARLEQEARRAEARADAIDPEETR